MIPTPPGMAQAIDDMWMEMWREEAESAQAWLAIHQAFEDGREVTHEWDEHGSLIIRIAPTSTTSGSAAPPESP